MLVLLMLLAAFLLFCSDLTLQADLHRFGSTRLLMIAQAAGIHKFWQISSLPGAASRLRRSRGSLLLGTLLRADHTRRFLLRHMRLEMLDVLLLLRTEDAARTALLSGAAQGLLQCIPAAHQKNVCIRVLPDFFRAHTTVQARCIIRIRLGILLLTAGMLLAAYLRQQHLTESEAT